MRERLQKEPRYICVDGNLDVNRHIEEAAQWLIRAQDAGSDRGVSYGANFGGEYLPSDPDTTGHIITTFLGLGKKVPGDSDYRHRAVEMGAWETAIQMESGAVMDGMYKTNPTPAVFNTGMVLLGWSALFDETGDEAFRRSGERAGAWLVQMQETNGNWIRGNSQFARSGSTVYNVKAAWGLARMGQALARQDFIEAAIRNGEFALSKQLANGWFADCCLENPSSPLLHTVAYAMQGLVGLGKITGRQEFLDAAARTAQSLRKLMHPDGFIPGAIDSNFRGTVNWCCLTGSAQTSIVWSALTQLLQVDEFHEAAERVNRYLMRHHDISNADGMIRGGVPGSWPVSGAYGRYRILNWATKFFIDALLMREGGEPCRYLT